MTAGDDGRSTVIVGIRTWLEQMPFVPPALAQYTELVTDGLLFFLERLPAERLETIVGDQLGLGDEAPPDARLAMLLRACPTLHKLGQVVAHEAGLPRDLRTRLQALESLTPATRTGGFADLVESELGRVPGLTLGSEVLAEGSVAAVLPFTWDAAPPGLPREGVFKALKPHAAQWLEEDLAIWPALGDFLEQRAAQAGLVSPDFRSTLDGVANLLANEIRLEREQERLVWAYDFYADSPSVVIPRLFPLCTPRLTAMERIAGRKITRSGAGTATRAMLARTLVDALLAKPFWSAPGAGAVFHADPHAGNIFATDDGRVAIFDWALTTALTPAQLGAVVRLLLAAATLDEPGVVRAAGELGAVRDAAAVRAVVAAGMADVRRGAFPGFGWLTPLLDRLARSGAVTFPEATALFRKLLLTLSGVVRDVSPQISIDEILLRAGGRQLIAESVLRGFTAPDSRAFGTHVSNADLLCLAASLPWIPARYALATYGEFLGAMAPR